jgi:ABC-type sulfate/molybdate transport systems ATPase subunit
VTRDQGKAMSMPDRIAIMNHGCIQQVGTAGEIYEKPTDVCSIRTPRSAELIFRCIRRRSGFGQRKGVSSAMRGNRQLAEQPDKARFIRLGLDGLGMKERALAERILAVSSVGIGGPYNLLLRSPVLGERMFDLFH